MGKERLLAFSDGVIAIIITIMVLELRPPQELSFAALKDMAPIFFSYVLSFVYVAIYWNNHHHMLHTVERVNGPVLWPICTCCFGCLWCRFQHPGWTRLMAPPRRQRFMVSRC